MDCEKIENLYLQSQYISQVFVHGNSLKVNIQECYQLFSTFIKCGIIHQIISRGLTDRYIFTLYDIFQSSVVAIIVPEIEVIKEYAAARKIPNTSFSFMCRHMTIKNLLQTEIDKISRQENLKDFETVCGSTKSLRISKYVF